MTDVAQHTASRRGLPSTVGVLLVGQTSRLALQGAYVVLLARTLDPSGFGAFVAVVALAAVAAPFSSLGANILMIRSVSRSAPDRATSVARALVLTTAGGLLLATALAALAPVLAPEGVPPRDVLLVVAADLVGAKLVETGAAAWQAAGRSRPLAVLPSLLASARLTVCVLLMAGLLPVASWAAWYAGVSIVVGVAVAGACLRSFGARLIRPHLSVAELRMGLTLSVGVAAQTAYNDIDKAMLARMVSTAGAGVYAAAFRLVDMAYAPVRTIAAATYPLHFEAGVTGVAGAVAITRRVAPVVLAYGVAAPVVLWACAPVAPTLLGAEYEAATGVVRALAVLILLRSLTYLAADTLTGADLHGARTTVQLVAAAVNVAANLVLLPSFGVAGAVASTIACEALLAAALWLMLGRRLRAERARGATT